MVCCQNASCCSRRLLKRPTSTWFFASFIAGSHVGKLASSGCRPPKRFLECVLLDGLSRSMAPHALTLKVKSRHDWRCEADHTFFTRTNPDRRDRDARPLPPKNRAFAATLLANLRDCRGKAYHRDDNTTSTRQAQFSAIHSSGLPFADHGENGNPQIPCRIGFHADLNLPCQCMRDCASPAAGPIVVRRSMPHGSR